LEKDLIPTPVHGGLIVGDNAHWRDSIPFHNYFHGDNGVGIGTRLIQQQDEPYKAK
jgi:hypothetical protein